jgi:hypothetical protein
VFGTGQAAQGSVPTSALVAVNFATAPDISIQAIQIEVDTPLAISGDNMQEHVDGISGLAPRPLPPLMGDLYTALDFTVSPTPVPGFIAGTSTIALVVPTNTLSFALTLFPADRGILAVEYDPTLTGNGFQAVSALDLEVIFIEGSPQATVAPSRRVGQLDYAGGSNLAASLGILPQNVDLVDRLPRLTDYARANFPFQGPGVDPVYPAYAVGFTGQQIAKADFTMAFAPGQNGIVRITQYKTREDFALGQANLAFQSWTIVPFTASVGLVYDNTVVPVQVNTYSFVANNTANSTAVGINRRFLSGILHYAPVDTFTLIWTGQGMYANTYKPEGAELLRSPLDTTFNTPIPYIDYSPSPTPNVADVSSLSNPNFTFNITAGGVRMVSPVIRLSKPNGFNDVATYLGDVLLIHEGSTLASSTTVETFRREDCRYEYLDDAELTYLPNGSGSFWDPTLTIAPSAELQVRAIDLSSRLNLGYGGGELTWPEFDYSTGYQPTTKDGATPQEDYSPSGLTALPFRGYVRAFDAQAPRREGRLRVDGTFKTPDYTSLVEMLLDVSNSGVDILLAATGATGVYYSSLLRPLGAGGIYTGVEVVNDNSVIFDYLLPHTPNLTSGFYPVTVQVAIEAGTLAAQGGSNFGIQRLSILPPL